MPDVAIVGRFPPPIDGQTMATARLADLLEGAHAVHRLDTEPPASAHVTEQAYVHPGRIAHFLRLRGALRERLAALPGATVLWPAVSPSLSGHYRDLLVTLPAFRPGQRVLAVVHRGNFDRVFRRPATALTARRLARRVDAFVFLNEALAENCASWLRPGQRLVVPNTIDDAVICTDEEVAAKQRARRARGALRLLFLSNMIASKGYLDVLEAARLLRARGVDVRADFAGRWTSDADCADFQRKVDAYGLADAVTHHGGVSERARVKALHRAADVFLLPTSYPTEAQPLTIIEALSAGTPVVATRHAGIPYMVREGQEALFVPPADPPALADAVQRLADYGAWKALSDGARRRFQEQFSPAAVRRRWLALLEPGASPPPPLQA